MVIHTNAPRGVSYLDMEAEVGITKHMGGMAATQELLALCHIEGAHTVLDVGCGIGVGPAYLARHYDCQVVGVDIAPKMIEWSRQRAREAGVAAQVKGLAANVLALPFEADHFDIVLCESVLIFVDDKAQAIRECVRVTRPGGYIGLNEVFWTEHASAERVARVQDALGPSVPTLDVWEALWAAAGLRHYTVNTYPIKATLDIKGRIDWIGWKWILRAIERGVRLYMRQPGFRPVIHNMARTTSDAYEGMGYGLFVGQK